MYASENYARFRSQQNGGAPPLPSSSSSGGVPSGPAEGMAPARGGAMGPPSAPGRPRGPPGGGHGGYDGMAAAMGSGPEVPPEELVKSLQPINGNAGGRYAAGGRRGEQPPSQMQMQMQMQMNMAMERRRNAAMSQAPRGPMGGRPPMQRDGGEEEWSPAGNYESMGGQERPGPGMNGYLPPVKYRRTGEFDGYDEPRNNNGGASGGGGGNGGGNGGGPMGNYRVPVNSYDLNEQQLQQQLQQQPQGRRQQLQQQPPTQQQQHPQQRQQQQQRGAYAQYAQSSATPPRTQEEMIMMRQRFLEQQQKQQQQQRYGGPPMEEPMGYRQPGPSSTPPGQGPPPPGAPPSSAAAAWARELEAYDQTRRVHRDMQVPTSQPGGGGAQMTPQAMAQMRMRGQPMAEHVSSPGSRIVTPAAALHNSQRNNRGMARHAGMPGQAPRGMPATSMANAMRGGETLGMSMEMAGRPESMRPSYEQEMEAMAAVAMSRTARSQRGPAVGGGVQGGPMGQRGAMPPGAGVGGGPGGFPMQDYEAMAMEREMGGAPGQERRQSRPTSASRSRGPQPGRGVSPHLAEVEAMDEPYLVQDDRYAMPPAAQLRAQAMIPQQQQMQQQAPSPAPLAPPVPEAAPAPARASKKRKEPAAPSKKQAKAEAKEAKAAAKATAKATKSSGKNASKNNDSNGGGAAEPKRRCGRKSMNYSSEQKRERNRAAVKKCRQRQALKYEYLKRKAEVLASENRALSEMLVKNVELDEEKRNSLTRGIQMDILLKIKEIFTQSLPKDFVLNADSIWDLNSVLAVSMPSRCYYGIESIKDFWRTSLRMRNKGKIRSFWAWLFRLPPGDRFTEFTIEPFSSTSNLYFINWTTKSSPPLSGSIVIMFGHGHRVTLHVEIFGWLIWRYLLTNTPFPEPPME